ncbi:MAG: rhodanese-like domain-containing protein [Anaerolineae bacterium]|nr:rhodanese-like domain-containing protein [Anaerolineae bacterium]
MFLFRKDSNYQSLNTKEYQEQFYNNKETKHFLLDVRTTQEFKSGHIPGAVNIPLDQLSAKIAKVPDDVPVIVVCQSGNRSRTGSDILVRGGRQEVYNLNGGTMRWAMSGLPVER